MNNKEVAKKVCDRILAIIAENGVLPWCKPWSSDTARVKVIDGYTEITLPPVAWNRSGEPYKGVNTYLPVGEYITFNQCRKEKGTVKKGAHGFPVVYWNFLKKETTDADGNKKTETIPLLKYYTVFRVSDCDGIKQKHKPAPRVIRLEKSHYEPKNGASIPLNEAAESIISDYIARAGNGFHVDRDGVTDRAYYSPSEDFVNVPCIAQFSDSDEFYSTLFHELAHSTGHSTRLNRFTGKAACAAFGSTEYSKEELVAEITAATILNALNLESANSFRNSAAYVKNWSEKIASDPLCYVSAASKAQSAFDLIMNTSNA